MSWEFIIFTSVDISAVHIEFFWLHISKFKKNFREEKVKPDAGLEPATARLRVWCSTDWANRAVIGVARESDRCWVPLCVQLSTFNKDDTDMIPKLQQPDFPQVSMCGLVILLFSFWKLKHGWWESTLYSGSVVITWWSSVYTANQFGFCIISLFLCRFGWLVNISGH